MVNYLKRLYLEGRLTEAGLQKAVDYGWITTVEAGQIKAAKTRQDNATTEPPADPEPETPAK